MIGQPAVEGVEYSISDTCVPAAFITGLLPQVAEARANNNRNSLTRTERNRAGTRRASISHQFVRILGFELGSTFTDCPLKTVGIPRNESVYMMK